MLSQQSPGCVPGLRLLMNDHPVLPSGQVGKPTFTSTYIHPDDPDTWCMLYAPPLIGDLDGDGNNDFIAIQRNDGNSSWWDPARTQQERPAEQVRVPRVQLYRGDGTGGFTRDLAFEAVDGLSVAGQVCASAGRSCHGAYVGGLLADVDQDGDLDLILVPHSMTAAFHVLANDGSGGFSNHTSQPSALTRTTCHTPCDYHNQNQRLCMLPKLADIDGDGYIDVVCAARLWRNDGSGGFTEDTANSFTSGDATSDNVAVGDIDGDGDNDLVVSQPGSGAAGTNANGNIFVLYNPGDGLVADEDGRALNGWWASPEPVQALGLPEADAED